MKKSRQGRGEKWTHVLALIQQKGGAIDTNDPDLIALLGGPNGTDGSVFYRLATYISYARRYGKVTFKTIRAAEKAEPGKRRKVVRYELTAEPVIETDSYGTFDNLEWP